MKTRNVWLIVAGLLLTALTYQPAEAGVHVGVGVGIGLPAFTFAAPPALAVIPGTYVYYPPDAGVDIVFYGGRWYRPWGGRWYWARGYNGPWAVLGPRYVPAPLLRLPPNWRRGVVYERIPYNHFHRNWRTWDRDRYWERNRDWWRTNKNFNHERNEMREHGRHDDRGHR